MLPFSNASVLNKDPKCGVFNNFHIHFPKRLVLHRKNVNTQLHHISAFCQSNCWLENWIPFSRSSALILCFENASYWSFMVIVLCWLNTINLLSVQICSGPPCASLLLCMGSNEAHAVFQGNCYLQSQVDFSSILFTFMCWN